MGDRAENIARAIEALASHGVRVTRQSSLYETEPVDVKDQGWFLNSVIEGETDWAPTELMNVLLGIERGLGRKRRVPKGPRVIDIDILLFGSTVRSHTGSQDSASADDGASVCAGAIAEIAPGARHPGLQKTIAQLLDETPDRSQLRPFTA